MNKGEIERDVRKFLQKEFYLENKSDDLKNRMQHAAAKYVHEKYPEVTRIIIDVDYFNEVTINIQ